MDTFMDCVGGLCRIFSRIPLSRMVLIWFCSIFRNIKCSISSVRMSGMRSLSMLSSELMMRLLKFSFYLSLGSRLAFSFFFLKV